MVKTLADEYHGRKCHSTKRLYEMAIFHRDQSPIERWEDESAHSLYIAGEITRAEWQLAKDRKER